MDFRMSDKTKNHLVFTQRVIYNYIKVSQDLVDQEFSCPLLQKTKYICLKEIEKELCDLADRQEEGIMCLLNELEAYYRCAGNFCPGRDKRTILTELMCSVEDTNFICSPISKPNKYKSITELSNYYSTKSILARVSLEEGQSTCSAITDSSALTFSKRINKMKMLDISEGLKSVWIKFLLKVLPFEGYEDYDSSSYSDDNSSAESVISEKPCVCNVDPPELKTPIEKEDCSFEEIVKNDDGFFKVISNENTPTADENIPETTEDENAEMIDLAEPSEEPSYEPAPKKKKWFWFF